VIGKLQRDNILPINLLLPEDNTPVPLKAITGMCLGDYKSSKENTAILQAKYQSTIVVCDQQKWPGTRLLKEQA